MSDTNGMKKVTKFATMIVSCIAAAGAIGSVSSTVIWASLNARMREEFVTRADLTNAIGSVNNQVMLTNKRIDTHIEWASEQRGAIKSDISDLMAATKENARGINVLDRRADVLDERTRRTQP